MGNNNALMRTDTLGYKIRKFFASLFKSTKKKQSVCEYIIPVELESKKNAKQMFKEDLKIETETQIEKMVRRLKTKELMLKELTEEQKEEVIAFLEEEVLAKKTKLQSLKNAVLYNKLKSSGDMQSVLSRVAKEHKISFIEYLKNEIEIGTAKLQNMKVNVSGS